MVSTQVSQEQVDGTVILTSRGFAERRLSEILPHVGTAAPKDVGEEFVCFPYLRSQRGPDVLRHGPRVLLIHVL
jgi:hypothetical protein